MNIKVNSAAIKRLTLADYCNHNNQQKVDVLKQKVDFLTINCEVINANWTYMTNDVLTDLSHLVSWYAYSAIISRGTTPALIWNHEKQPSFTQALYEIIRAPIKTECASAARIQRLALVTSMIGDEGLLKLASYLNKEQQLKNYDLINALSWHFFTKVEDDHKSAFYAYPYVNIEEYQIFKSGIAGNHNVIKLPNGLYVGFDPDFFYAARTEDELEYYMFQQFINSEDLREGMESKHTEFCSNLTFSSFKEKRLQYQKRAGYFIFDERKAETEAEVFSRRSI